MDTVLQSRKPVHVSAQSKQILPFVFARHNKYYLFTLAGYKPVTAKKCDHQQCLLCTWYTKIFYNFLVLVCILSFLCVVFKCMSLMEQEKSTISEKLANMIQDLNVANLEYERLKREATTKQEQDRSTINNMQTEIRNLRLEFDETS